MQEVPHSPLTDIALSAVFDILPDLSEQQLQQVTDACDAYLVHQISFAEAVAIVHPILGTNSPIEKLSEIMTTPDNPIPHPGVTFPINPKLGGRRVKTRQWNAYEDRRLLAAIYKFGPNDWSIISNYVGNGRTKAQCSQRWQRGLDPKIKKTPWSAEQDAKLLRLVETYGDKRWTKIAAEIGERSDVQCRYRYHQLKKTDDFDDILKRAKEEEDEEEIVHKPTPPPQTRKQNRPVAGNPTTSLPTQPNPAVSMFAQQQLYAPQFAYAPMIQARAGMTPAVAFSQIPQMPQIPQLSMPQMMMQIAPQTQQITMPQMNLVQPTTQLQAPLAVPPVVAPPPQDTTPQMSASLISAQPSSTQILPQPSGDLIHFDDSLQLSASGSFFQWAGNPNGTAGAPLNPFLQNQSNEWRE